MVACVVLASSATAVGACSSPALPTAVAEDAGWLPIDGGQALFDAAQVVADATIVTADAAATCAPASVTGYHPVWTPPKARQSVCTAADVVSYGACVDANDPSSSACAPWLGADASSSGGCKACLADSKQTDPAWGPLVDVGATGSDRQINVAGCMAIVLHDTGSGCAGSVQALQLCEAASCADNCAGAPTSALVACTQQADGTGCGNYVAPAACVSDAGAAALSCFGTAGATFGQKLAAVAAVFCVGEDGG